MPTSLDNLPDDPTTLKRIIADLSFTYEARIDTLQQDHEHRVDSLQQDHEEQVDSLKQDHEQRVDALEQDHEQQVDALRQDHAEQLETLKEQLRLALKREFGRSSEAAPGQGELFNEAEQLAAASDTEPETEVPAYRRRKPGRKPLPAHLPRIEVVYELEAAQRTCPNDGQVLTEIGAETSELLDIVPAKVRVIRRVRKKYACPDCESHVARAPVPASLIPKSIASPNLLAQIALYKYQDALPLYRQEQILERLGVTVSRTTQANWMIRVGQALAPLLERMREDLLKARVVHSDETTLQVLKEAGRRPDQKSYMWVQVAGTGPPIVLYHYAPSRARSVVERLLDGYQGTLVTDGYSAYDSVPARHAGCWAHARRKFHEALKAQPKGKTGKALVGFNHIQKLFHLEKGYRDLSPAQRQRARQERSKPVIDQLRVWLDDSLPRVSPKTLVGKALGYLDGQWDKLITFLEDGEVPIHNNLAENKIRPFVIGRKNWIFSDSVQGAHASAALYSLMETAKANDLELSMYLAWLFHTLPNTKRDDIEAMRALLPYQVDRERIVEYFAQEARLLAGADK